MEQALPVYILGTVLSILTGLSFLAWCRYLWVVRKTPKLGSDKSEFSLTETFSGRHLLNCPHQKGVAWLTDVFSRSARAYPNHPALQVPSSGEVLTYQELDRRAEVVASALANYVTGPDQVVAVAMSQDNADIIAAHLGILRSGAALMFIDTTLPDALITHMLNDAQPVAVLTRGQAAFRDIPTIDLKTLPDSSAPRVLPTWLDDPKQRLATIFYTSGTTGMPKGVENTHAGYVNLALSYADYFDLVPGVDATTLTSSLGYDGSISEMYCAWVRGCTVVLLTKEEVRSGPDLVPILCKAEVTVLFCPPVLLTTLTSTPEEDLPYPICRYIVPAGEAFPSALVEPWTKGRRQIINTYGPTEASTDTSRQTLRPGEPVTIGTPLANVTYVILDFDSLTPLPHGEVGELCIGGVHVARGYRNLPEQTAQKFVVHPEYGRLYRTGDKCRIDKHSKQVHFLGRNDIQLKVRGHRVEAQAVEDILQNQFPEIETAVVDYQNKELIAFVLATSIAQTGGSEAHAVPAPEEWATKVLSKLATQLPEPAVPSRLFCVDSFVLKPLSGKIDRRCLPNLAALQLTTTVKSDSRSTDTASASVSAVDCDHEFEPGALEVLAICREVFDSPLGVDDVFADSGGHSILIAHLTQRLQSEGWQVSVRALLTNCNTARKVAIKYPRKANIRKAKIESDNHPLAEEPENHKLMRDEAASKVLSIPLFTFLQVLLGILLTLPEILLFVAFITFIPIGEIFAEEKLWQFLLVGTVLFLASALLPFFTLLWVMVIKLFMGGRVYRNRVAPGVYPKWSRMHLRVWYIGRLESTVLRRLGRMFRSAPLMAFTLRQLGARVGKNLQCAHAIELSGPLDLLTIGNDVAIQTGAYIQTTKWVGQELHIGPIEIGDNCKIGMRAGIGCHVKIGAGSWVNPFTPILKSINGGGLWEGSPARRTGRFLDLKRPETCHQSSCPRWILETFNIVMQICFDLILVILPSAAIAWYCQGMFPAVSNDDPSGYFLMTPLRTIFWNLILYSIFATWGAIVVTSILSCLFLRWTPASPGLYPSQGIKASLLLYRVRILNRIQSIWTWTITGQYLRAIAGVKFSKVGASECDIMFNLVPELSLADSQVFWANGSFTNMLDYGSKFINLQPLSMPHNFFSGNNCVAEQGFYPANFLVGVSTRSDDIEFRRQMNSRFDNPITVVGNPPLRVASAAPSDSEHVEPSFPLFFTRTFLNDFFSIGILRSANLLVYTICFTLFLRHDVRDWIAALVAIFASELILITACVMIKKILVGNWGSNHSTPFWSWRHFSYFFSQDCYFAWCRRSLTFTAGTVLSNSILRLMGCQVGKRTIVTSPMQASDWNAVSFGSDCVINGFLQFHTFENMRLKVKLSEIHDSTNINFGTTVMGGAVIEDRSDLAPLSMVLKEMKLRSARYEGSPAEFLGEPISTVNTEASALEVMEPALC